MDHTLIDVTFDNTANIENSPNNASNSFIFNLSHNRIRTKGAEDPPLGRIIPTLII